TATLADSLSNDFDATDGELQALRFMDYNNDKLIDLIRADENQTSYLENRGEQGFVLRDEVPALGASFRADGVQLTDMNGDGLQDVVQVNVNQVRYRLNFGWGQWGDWVNVENLVVTDGEVARAELEDLNGDGMSDLVIVDPAGIKYALNKNTTSFTDMVTLSNSSIDGDLPTDDNVTVLYADMNANGSTDIVWIDGDGQVDYLELFPVRPNLLNTIENGLGQVTRITYGSSVQHMARDGGLGAWEYKLPHPMLVVDEVDKYEALTGGYDEQGQPWGVHEITQYRYHNGFYDGIEKQFRGYERVEMMLVGDDTQEMGETEYTYDVGATDPYYNGLMLSQAVASGGRALSEIHYTYSECDVDQVPAGTELPVRHICQTATETTLKEGAASSAWVVTRSSSAYDGYGNVTLSHDEGVVSIGGQGCEPCAADRDEDAFGKPCGAQCIGDESFATTEYIEPGSDTNDRWIIGSAFRERMYGREGSALVSESLTYYDGADFEGLELGQLDQGKVTRVTRKIDIGSDDVIQAVRNAFDVHGNVIETIDPNGIPGEHKHRRQYTYDDDQLRVVRAEVLLEDKEGKPYKLRRDVAYEPLFDKTMESTDWLRIDSDGVVVSTTRSFFFLYDEFSRMVQRILPGGDSSLSPTETFTYDLGNPSSRIITKRRSQIGGEMDIETINCMDGRGRTFQTRTRLDEDLYQVSGFQVFNVRATPVRSYQPYTSPSAECETAEANIPDHVRYSEMTFDATYRPLNTIAADAEIYGTASITRTEYLPLTSLAYHGEDNSPGS
ncbi:MAG: toxin TcdB middle/N-terminal domain-containing protein, partial [Myxococcota bacterium]